MKTLAQEQQHLNQPSVKPLMVEVVEVNKATALERITKPLYDLGVTKEELNKTLLYGFGRAYLQKLKQIADSGEVNLI